jgi:hypothetical protein
MGCNWAAAAISHQAAKKTFIEAQKRLVKPCRHGTFLTHWQQQADKRGAHIYHT